MNSIFISYYIFDERKLLFALGMAENNCVHVRRPMLYRKTLQLAEEKYRGTFPNFCLNLFSIKQYHSYGS
jgi:hypothetical protein